MLKGQSHIMLLCETRICDENLPQWLYSYTTGRLFKVCEAGRLFSLDFKADYWVLLPILWHAHKTINWVSDFLFSPFIWKGFFFFSLSPEQLAHHLFSNHILFMTIIYILLDQCYNVTMSWSSLFDLFVNTCKISSFSDLFSINFFFMSFNLSVAPL